MMLVASGSLVVEGALHEPHHRDSASTDNVAADATVSAAAGRVVLGVLLGYAFVYLSKLVLDRYEDLKFSGFQGAQTRHESTQCF
jgi:hypothetical protein